MAHSKCNHFFGEVEQIRPSESIFAVAAIFATAALLDVGSDYLADVGGFGGGCGGVSTATTDFLDEKAALPDHAPEH